MAQRLLVVGGNGFLGSSVCRTAVKKGWEVTSISSSGKPFRSPKGHLPDWTSKVNWQAASAFEPSSYSALLAGSTAVVHTIGTLYQNSSYKDAIRSGDLSALFQAVTTGHGENPLAASTSRSSYQALNHDSALAVLNTFLANSKAASSSASQKTFVYISAEDIFGPLVPREYITSKREAERDIAAACLQNAASGVRAVSLRPGLMYHPHLRPLTTPIATLLSASSKAHRFLRNNDSSGLLPTPASVLQTIASTIRTSPKAGLGEDEGGWAAASLRSAANGLEIPPMHVDHVAMAACAAIEAPPQDGNMILDVKEMREIIGWRWDGHGEGRGGERDTAAV